MQRLGNFLKAAQFRQSLADFQIDNGDLAQAVASYRLYAAITPSACRCSTRHCGLS